MCGWQSRLPMPGSVSQEERAAGREDTGGPWRTVRLSGVAQAATRQRDK
jgi:hypothetical protein